MSRPRSVKRALVLLALLCPCTLPAAASIDPALIARLHHAKQSIIEQSIMARGSGKLARPPRLTDPAARPALSEWEGTAALADTSFVAQDLDAVLAIGEDHRLLVHHHIDAGGPTAGSTRPRTSSPTRTSWRCC